VENKALFGSWSLAGAAATVLLVELFEPIMQAAVRAGQTAAWLSLLIAGLVAILLYWPVAACMANARCSNLIKLAEAAAGKTAAVITSVLVSAFVVYHSGFILRETSEMAVSAFYSHTPQTFPMVALGLCAFGCARGDLAGIVRLCRTFMPFLVGAMVVLLAGCVGWAKFVYLVPVLGPGVLPLLVNSALLSALHAPVALFLLVAAGDLTDRKRLGPAGSVALGGVTLLLAFGAALFLAIYPLPMGRSVTFPLHLLARLVSGGRFFERLEGIWIMFWFFATACHLAVLLHIAALSLRDAIGTPVKVGLLPLAVMIATTALFPPDQGRVLAWHAAAMPYALGVGYVLPLVLALTVMLRRRWTSRAG
jgi:hypothetical protein